MKEPRHPLALPDDTSGVGVAGWIAESVVRSISLRLAALTALLGLLLGAVGDGAPASTRVAAVVLGATVPIVLLASQLSAWPRRRQWLLIVTSTLVCGGVDAALLLGA